MKFRPHYLIPTTSLLGVLLQAAAPPSITIPPAVQLSLGSLNSMPSCPPLPGKSSFLLSLVPGYLNIPVFPQPSGGPFITVPSFAPSEKTEQVLTAFSAE